MKKKRKHAEMAEEITEDQVEQTPVDVEEDPREQVQEEKGHSVNDAIQMLPKHHHHERRKPKNMKPVFSRVEVDPTKKYRQPESRESWGPNVKGKKFRKEKGKKKRCSNSGIRIDGAVKSIRLDV